MCVQNKLGKILLLIIPSILASCSVGDKVSSPSLNADNIWDQMAGERQKPMPGNRQEDDSGEIFSDPPFETSTDPLSAEDIDKYRKSLLAADNKYQAIITALDEVFVTLGQKTATEDDRQTQSRTAQLYLSRLINLHNNIDRAVAALGEEDQTLRKKSRNLLVLMAENIIRSRNRLEGYN